MQSAAVVEHMWTLSLKRVFFFFLRRDNKRSFLPTQRLRFFSSIFFIYMLHLGKMSPSNQHRSSNDGLKREVQFRRECVAGIDFFSPTQYTFAFSEKRALIVRGWSVEFVKRNLSLRKIASTILFFFFFKRLIKFSDRMATRVSSEAERPKKKECERNFFSASTSPQKKCIFAGEEEFFTSVSFYLYQ